MGDQTDAVVDLIDNVLADTQVSPDAMRWAPEVPVPDRYAWIADYVSLRRALLAPADVHDSPGPPVVCGG